MNKKKAFILLSLFLLLFLLTQSCSNPWITGRGRIVFLSFEGGFYGIEADNGEHYDPTNLPADYMIDGLRVKFTVNVLSDVYSVHMWGHVVEIISIKKI